MKTTKQQGSGRHPDAGVIALGIRKSRFFTADQAVAWAIGSYGDALRDMHPPEGEPWLVDGVPWATPASFADAFQHAIQRRMADRFLSALGWPGEGQPTPLCFEALPVSAGSTGPLSGILDEVPTGSALLRAHMPSLPLCGKVAGDGSAAVDGGDSP